MWISRYYRSIILRFKTQRYRVPCKNALEMKVRRPDVDAAVHPKRVDGKSNPTCLPWSGGSAGAAATYPAGKAPEEGSGTWPWRFVFSGLFYPLSEASPPRPPCATPGGEKRGGGGVCVGGIDITSTVIFFPIQIYINEWYLLGIRS